MADEKDEGSDVDDGDIDAAYASIPAIKTVEYGERYYTDPTIWISVLPDTLNGTRAFELNKEIRTFLNGLNVTNVDIAFRESIALPMVRYGPAFYAPAETGDHLKEFIDNVSTALSLPICGRETTMQGLLDLTSDMATSFTLSPRVITCSSPRTAMANMSITLICSF